MYYMPILNKLITAFLALAGCTSLIITGEINLLMSASGIGLLPGYYHFLKGDNLAPRRVVGLLAGVTFLVFLFDAAIVSRDVFLAVAHMTITFQAIKSFDLTEPWDDLQVYFMSLLQLIIASELTMSFAFGIIFIFLLIMLVTAMVFSHYLKQGMVLTAAVLKPVAVISILTMIATTIFFLILPRTTEKFLGRSYVKGIQTAGFSEKVDFGSFGAVKLD